MAAPEFTHYLITRFNIPVEMYGPEKMNSTHLNETIIAHRLSLFQQYCVPSVFSQTTSNFIWLLYFDKNTNPVFLEQVRQSTKGSIAVEILLVESFEEFLKSIREHIIQAPTSWCITTRLDNDDIISHDFMQAIQQRFIPMHRTLINFTHGFEIDLTHHVIKKWTARYHNQFTSLIENKELLPLSGIYGFAHGAIPGDISILNIGETPRWAYTRHEYNFSPQKINARPVFTLKSLNGFPSLQGKARISWWNTLKYVLRWIMVTGNKRFKNYFGNAVERKK